MDGVNLFVYGTLRPGSRHPMARFLAEHARHLGPAQMPGRLYDLGCYPGMIAAQDAGDRVIGDLFAIQGDADTVLSKLDEYEGATSEPRLFQRVRGVAELDAGNAVAAWFYEYLGKVRAENWLPTGIYPS